MTHSKAENFFIGLYRVDLYNTAVILVAISDLECRFHDWWLYSAIELANVVIAGLLFNLPVVSGRAHSLLQTLQEASILVKLSP